MVSSDHGSFDGPSNHSTGLSESTTTSIRQNQNSSVVPKVNTACSSFIGKQIGMHELPEQTANIILDSWRTATKTKYESILNRWAAYCSKRENNPFSTTVNEILLFLTELYNNGCHYSGLCNARSALATSVQLIGGPNVSNHPLICRFIKGIYNRHPPMPIYVKIWDINKVLNYIDSLPVNEELSYKQLTQKLVVLLMILGARRKQALHSVQIDNVVLDENACVLLPNKVLKHSKPGRNIEPIIYHSFEHNKLCVVKCIKQYIKQRCKLVNTEQKALFITYGKPHKQASPDTISRWIKNMLSESGVDITVYKAHSCRSASTSKANNIGITMKEILDRGCWSNDHTSKKFYGKDVIIGNAVDFNYV